MGEHSLLQTQEPFGDKTSGLENAPVYSAPCGSLAVMVCDAPGGQEVG